jgi:hypothetical protein
VPQIVLALGRELSSRPHNTSRIANDLLDLVCELCELRASSKDHTLPNPASIITSLLHLDDLVIAWGTARSKKWDYSTVFDSSDPESLYDDTCAVYTAYWIAGTWNIQRSTRIFIHEAVLVQIDELLTLPQTPTTTLQLLSQRTLSLATITSSASDICASCPYLLGHNRPYADQLSNPTPAACGYFLLTSIYLAGSTVGVPHSMRMYVLGRLRYIGHRMGIHQALLVADILQADIESGRAGEVMGFPRQWGRRRYRQGEDEPGIDYTNSGSGGMTLGIWGIETRREEDFDKDVQGVVEVF